MRKIRQIALKEVRHILRDSRSLIIAIAMPILMTFLYGYAINLDVKNIRLAVLDFDQSQISRQLSSRFYSSGYFIPPRGEPDINDPEAVLRKGQAAAVVVLKPGFGEALGSLQSGLYSGLSKGKYQVGVFLDGADANTAAAAGSYTSLIIFQYMQEFLPPNFTMPGVTIAQQVRYNPDLKSSHFFVPGLIAIILMMISAMLTSVTIAREKETGTMEQLLTTPITPRQIIAGKTIPYIGLALLDGFLILAFGVFHFGVPFVGSTWLLLLFGVIYVTAALSIGILISTLVKTQQLALMAAQLITVLPSVMLSGFIFEIKNMPTVLQWVTHIVPARYFIAIIRGIMLKGADLTVLWTESLFLLGLAAFLLTVAAKRFRMKIG